MKGKACLRFIVVWGLLADVIYLFAWILLDVLRLRAGISDTIYEFADLLLGCTLPVFLFVVGWIGCKGFTGAKRFLLSLACVASGMLLWLVLIICVGLPIHFGLGGSI